MSIIAATVSSSGRMSDGPKQTPRLATVILFSSLISATLQKVFCQQSCSPIISDIIHLKVQDLSPCEEQLLSIHYAIIALDRKGGMQSGSECINLVMCCHDTSICTFELMLLHEKTDTDGVPVYSLSVQFTLSFTLLKTFPVWSSADSHVSSSFHSPTHNIYSLDQVCNEQI